VSGRRRCDHVGVRNPSRGVDEAPFPGVEPVVAHRHLIASFQHVGRLVRTLVDVLRGPHVKAIFAKVGLSSRSELVARLFAEYYEPVHLEPTASTSRHRVCDVA
jgi:hypothetical protein